MDSGTYFLRGLLGEAAASSPLITEDNHLLRFYDECPKFITEVEENEATFAEQRELEAGEAWADMVAAVGTRTGVEVQQLFFLMHRKYFQNIEVDHDLVGLAWEMCRFERAWAGEAAVSSEYPPWCALFSASDLGLFEFGEDLKYVYNDGPVYDITSRMTQPLFEVNVQSRILTFNK